MGFRVSILRRSSGGVAGVSGDCPCVSFLMGRVPRLWLLIFHSFEASRTLPHSSVSLSGVDVFLPLRNDSIHRGRISEPKLKLKYSASTPLPAFPTIIDKVSPSECRQECVYRLCLFCHLLYGWFFRSPLKTVEGSNLVNHLYRNGTRSHEIACVLDQEPSLPTVSDYHKDPLRSPIVPACQAVP